MRKISEEKLDLLVGVLRGHSINDICNECDIKPRIIEDVLMGRALSNSDADELEYIIREYSEE